MNKFLALAVGIPILATSSLLGDTPQKVNDLWALRASKVNEAIQIERKANGAWMNESYTSEKIEAGKKRCAELEKELYEARLALKKAYNDLPEVKALREKAAKLREEAARLEQRALGRRVEQEKEGERENDR